MPNRDDILTLARAGFTAQQIAVLLAEQPAQPVQPAQPAQPEQPAQPAPAPAPQPAPEPAPAPAPAPAPQPAQPDTLSQLLQQMTQLTGAIQANAILQSKQPQPETADDVIASIIRPPKKEGDGK